MYGALQHAVEYSAATMIVQFSTRIFMSQSVHSLKPFTLSTEVDKELVRPRFEVDGNPKHPGPGHLGYTFTIGCFDIPYACAVWQDRPFKVVMLFLKSEAKHC